MIRNIGPLLVRFMVGTAGEIKVLHKVGICQTCDGNAKEKMTKQFFEKNSVIYQFVMSVSSNSISFSYGSLLSEDKLFRKICLPVALSILLNKASRLF